MLLTLFKTFLAGTFGFLTALSQPIPSPTPTIVISSYEGKSMYPTIEQDTATESASLPTLSPSPTPTNAPTSTIVPTSTPIPTATPLPTMTPTLTPTSTPRPTQTPQPTSKPPTPTTGTYTPIPTIPHSLNPETIFQLINTHRESIQQPAYQTNEYLCKLADERIPELPDEVSGKKYIHQGLYDRNLPYWITENMSYYPSEQAIFNWWLKSSLHRRALEGNYQYSCGACNGTICIQLFTNFTPRNIL